LKFKLFEDDELIGQLASCSLATGKLLQNVFPFILSLQSEEMALEKLNLMSESFF
jgi:hypothetical protein